MTWDQTSGGGLNAPGGSVNSVCTSASNCTAIDRTPYAFDPGGDAIRASGSDVAVSVIPTSAALRITSARRHRFIRLNGLRLKVAAQVHGAKASGGKK